MQGGGEQGPGKKDTCGHRGERGQARVDVHIQKDMVPKKSHQKNFEES